MSIGSTIRAGAAYVEVTAETSKLQRNLTSAQAQLQAFGRTCTTVGKDLLVLSGAMSLPLIMAAKSFAGFDDSMRLVQAVTQATDADFKALTVTAQRLGRETSYTAQQVADAMVSLGRMGFSPDEIQAAIADVLNLARATGTELAEAGDIAANSLRIFGMEAGKMGDAADVLTVTANSSAQTLIDLFEALKMGGPQAAAAGENIRETCASLAVLANLGIKGSLAGTALRKSFSQFAKVKIQDQLRAVGVETVDSNGNLRKMAEIMRDIAKVMQTMPTAEKLAFAEDIFDIRGSLAGLTLTANTEELDAMIAKLLDVEGVAADTAKKMDAGLGGSFRLLMSAVEGSLNAIAAAMNSTLQPFVNKVTDVINVFTKWIERNQGLVTAFAAVVAGAAVLGVALIAVGVAAKGVAAGIAVVQGVTRTFAFAQGMFITQATALKSSILLIGQAFANYRNLAIPAMVGTEQFCATLGVVSSASNRARAGIILMSNAEAAAAAKSFLAAKWQALTTALSSLRAGAIASTIALKAQSAAELICTASTTALNSVRNIGIAVATAFTAANLKSAIAVGAVTAGNFLLAAAAKVAAIAMMGLSAVMSFIAVHPVAMALLALVAVLGGICIALYNASKYTAKLSDEAAKLREKNDQLRKTDEARMQRLQQLASKQRLTNAEMAEARVLADKLQKKYGNLGIVVKDSSIEISDLNAAVKRLDSVKFKIDSDDMPDFDRLKNLSFKAELSIEEQGDADSIIQRLKKKYGSLGVKIDKISGKIVRLNNVASNLHEIKLKVSGQEDIDKVTRLQQLAVMPKLESSHLSEANILISQLKAKYGEFGITVDTVNGRIVSLTEAQRKFAEATEIIRAGNDPLKETHLAQLKRLQQLTEQEKLTTEEQQEAESIVSALNAAYNGMGLGIDKVTGKLKLAADAQKKFNAAMKEAALSELDAEILELEANISELQRENSALDSYWNHNLVSQTNGRQQEAIRKTQANNDRMIAYRQKIIALQQRRQAIQDNDESAVTGEGNKKPTTEDRVQSENQRQQADAAAIDQAEKRVADIERRLQRERQTELENEIQDIRELQTEYKKLLQTMLDFELSKTDDKQDKKKIADLERKLVEADRSADERIAAAKRRAAQNLKDEVAEYQLRFDSSEQNIRKRRGIETQDREIEAKLKVDKDAAIRELQILIDKYKISADEAKDKFKLELQAAQADGKIDDNERRRIDAAHSAYTEAESMVDKYSVKLRHAQSGTQQAAESTDSGSRTKAVAAWSANELDALLGGATNVQERTAKASEQIAANTKETNRQIKRLSGGGATLTYG